MGFPVEDADEVLKLVRAILSEKNIRLMSHLASADERGSASTLKRLTNFHDLVSQFDGPISIANSAVIFGWQSQLAALAAAEHWVRPGITLFGISAFADSTGIDFGLLPVVQFEARLISKKALRTDQRVGYGGIYKNSVDTTLGIISAGYGDGYSRHFRHGTPVLTNNRQVPLIGRVSMAMTAVDLGTTESIGRVGDITTLWGDGLLVETIAPWAHASAYDLVCGVMNSDASRFID